MTEESSLTVDSDGTLIKGDGSHTTTSTLTSTTNNTETTQTDGGLEDQNKGKSQSWLRNVSKMTIAGASQIAARARALDVAADGVWQRASEKVAQAATQAAQTTTAATARLSTASQGTFAKVAHRTDKCRVCGTSQCICLRLFAGKE